MKNPFGHKPDDSNPESLHGPTSAENIDYSSRSNEAFLFIAEKISPALEIHIRSHQVAGLSANFVINQTLSSRFSTHMESREIKFDDEQFTRVAGYLDVDEPLGGQHSYFFLQQVYGDDDPSVKPHEVKKIREGKMHTLTTVEDFLLLRLEIELLFNENISNISQDFIRLRHADPKYGFVINDVMQSS